MTILFRPQGAFGWFSYTTSRDTIHWFSKVVILFGAIHTPFVDVSYKFSYCPTNQCEAKSLCHGKSRDRA
ncbi:hypothetical protein DM819_14520 [Pseudomonas hunanensis]|uniref:Uncharacterized protein n=1 Tax=Pseudomonas hunanensis TaxID=1247546 RepID=A0ABD6MZU7_9PSED|nr:hypothetical protein [Pseudomonas hunanensis]